MYYIVLFNAIVCCVMLRCLAFSCSYQIVFSMATHRCIQYGHTSLYSVWPHIVVFSMATHRCIHCIGVVSVGVYEYICYKSFFTLR